MIAFPIASLLILAIILLLGWAIGRALRGHPKPLAYGLGTVAAIIFVMLFLMIGVRSSVPVARLTNSASDVGRPNNDAIQPQMPEAEPPVQASTWEPSDRIPFEANLYPSKASAMRAIIRHNLAKSLASILPENATLKEIRLSTQLESDLTPDAVTAIDEALSNAGITGVSTVIVGLSRESSQSSLKPDEIHVTVETLQSPVTDSVNTPSAEANDGVLQVTMKGANGHSIRSARFTQAEWCEDFQRWQRMQLSGSPPGTWILATSDSLCSTISQASQQARTQAGTQIAARVMQLQYLHTRPDAVRFGLLDLQPPAAMNWLRTVADQRIVTGQLNVKRFDQAFSRPYGSVWRSAMLVRVDESDLQSLAHLYGSHRTAESRTWVGLALSTTALLGVILVVYLFLNAATRGYYTWSVRIATVVLAAVGVWCILVLA